MQVIKFLGQLATLIIFVSGANAQILAEDYKGKCLVAIGAHDYKTALKECSILAHQGNRSAMSVLGTMYYDGEGVRQDYIRAHMWYNIAAAGQAPNSSNASLRDDLAKKLTRDDIALAQGMASECMNSGFQNCGD